MNSFNDSIPKYLLDLYNGYSGELSLYKEISRLLRDKENTENVDNLVDEGGPILKIMPSNSGFNNLK